MLRHRKVNPVIVAKGEDLGNGYCLVPETWLPKATLRVAQENNLIFNGKCIISNEFIDNPWHANAVYSLSYAEYSA